VSGALRIRRMVPADAAGMARMMAEPEVYGGLMQMPYPSEPMWAARLASPPEEGSAELKLVAERDGELVGSLGLHPVTQRVRRHHVAILGLSVVRAAQRSGVGLALMTAALDYADRWTPIRRIELTVYSDNAGAIALYRRCGFEHEGTHRAYALRDGVYVDSHTMARLHPNPPGLTA
jgi:putative acetyltransferase